MIATTTWLEHGTTTFLDALASLTDDDLNAPTGLPGWSRRHVVAHVHHNAEALSRLAAWAASGVENPMYASPEQRAAEIQQGATMPAQWLRASVAKSATALAADLDTLSQEAWESEVVTAQGRRIPAAEIPWLRTREVVVHAVDLGAGTTLDALPADLLEALAVDVVRHRVRRGEGPGLVGWLTGRSAAVNALGPWL